MQLNPINTPVTTVGNGTLLTAALLGLIISRSGPTGAFTDSFDSTTNIVHALKGMGGASFMVEYINNSAFVATLQAGDASTTVTGSVNIPANSTATILFTRGADGTTSVTAVVLFRNANN